MRVDTLNLNHLNRTGATSESRDSELQAQMQAAFEKVGAAQVPQESATKLDDLQASSAEMD